MSKIDKIMDNLMTTDTKVKLSINTSRISFESNNVHRESRYKGDQDDTLTNIVSAVAFEAFNINTGLWSIDRCRTKQEAMHRMVNFILDFLCKEMPQKHPKETNLYKFFRQLVHTNSMSQQVEDIIAELIIFIGDESRSPSERKENGLKICQYVYAKFK